MDTNLRFVALDLSLQATGIAYTHDHYGEPRIGCRTVHTARTRHGATDIDHRRLHTILTDIAAAVRCKPHLTLIEWQPAYAGNEATSLRIAELHGVVKHWLFSKGCRYLDVKPVDLKIWATGNGNAKKTEVREAVIATYGQHCHIRTDDEADALAMLTLACRAYGQPLTRVTNQKQLRALTAAVKWPELATEAGPVVPS